MLNEVKQRSKKASCGVASFVAIPETEMLQKLQDQLDKLGEVKVKVRKKMQAIKEGLHACVSVK